MNTDTWSKYLKSIPASSTSLLLSLLLLLLLSSILLAFVWVYRLGICHIHEIMMWFLDCCTNSTNTWLREQSQFESKLEVSLFSIYMNGIDLNGILHWPVSQFDFIWELHQNCSIEIFNSYQMQRSLLYRAQCQ